jgi:uncharacterized membrane protein (DUF2068 family)
VSAAPPVPAPDTAGDTAVRVILVYKLVKGLFLVTAGAILTAALVLGLGTNLREYAARVHAHATGAWALHATELLARFASPKWLHWSSVALELDGTMNLVEAWALEKKHWWGPWMVVVVTGLFLPAEVWELIRHPRASRVALLVANALILVFLVWYARRHAR